MNTSDIYLEGVERFAEEVEPEDTHDINEKASYRMRAFIKSHTIRMLEADIKRLEIRLDAAEQLLAEVQGSIAKAGLSHIIETYTSEIDYKKKELTKIQSL